MKSFSAKIQIIGVNPYVLLPLSVIEYIFQKAGKDKGPIPVRGRLDDHNFIQTLVKYSGKWRLYLNTPMRKAAGKYVGDSVNVSVDFDPNPRTIPLHPKLKRAFRKDSRAKTAFEKLSAYRQKEILKYINQLKSAESVERNIKRAIVHLTGKKPFVGR